MATKEDTGEWKRREDDGGVLRFIKHAEALLVGIITVLILWLGNTTYNNSLILVKLHTQMETLVLDLGDRTARNTALIQEHHKQHAESLKELKVITENRNARVDHNFDTIWPRMREMKERIQHLESQTPDRDKRAKEPWKY